MIIEQPGIHSVIAMQAAGFRYTGSGDTARCNQCELEVSNWKLSMTPMAAHSQNRPSCPFVRSMQPSRSSSILPPSTSESAVNSLHEHERERDNRASSTVGLFETSQLQQARLRTFSHWPHGSSPTGAQMIAAGFFHCNVQDRVICIYCNLICHQWSARTDDPCEVHRTLAPHCPYARSKLIGREGTLIAGENAVVASGNLPARSSHTLATDEDTLQHLVQASMDLPFAKHLILRHFKASIVQQCFEDQLRLKRKQPI